MPRSAFSGIVRDGAGRFVPGATVNVYHSGTSTLATIYTTSTASEPPASQANPFTADANGKWGFCAEPGVYDVVISGSGIAGERYDRLLVMNLSTSGSTYLFGPGATAAASDYPNAVVISSLGDSGHTYANPIALVGEAICDGSGNCTGVGGVAETLGTENARGVVGVARVAASADTGTAYGVQGSSIMTHSGGDNIACYGNAANGANNYSFYGAAGDIYNAGNATVDGTMTIGGATTIASITGMLKATAGLVSAATSGTDYVAGGSGAVNQISVFSGTGTIGGSANLTWNGSTLYANGALTITGTATLAAALSGVLKATSGVVSAATAGTDYIAGSVGALNQVAYFTASGVLDGNAALTFDPAGNLSTSRPTRVTDSTATTSTTTGALVVTGGIGAGGGGYFGGQITTSATMSATGALYAVSSTTATSGTVAAQRISATASPSGPTTAINIGSYLTNAVNTGNAQNFTSSVAVVGLWNEATHKGTGTVTGLAGCYGVGQNESTGTITNCAALRGVVKTLSTGTITNGYGLLINSAVKLSTGPITTNYGIYVEAQSNGNTNYAIYTNAGLVRFGDNVDLASGKVYKINNVQVVGAQVAAIGLDAKSDADKITDIITALRAHGILGPNA